MTTLLGNEKRDPYFKVPQRISYAVFQKYQILFSVSQLLCLWHMIHIFMTATDFSHFMTVIAGKCHDSGS